MSEAADSSLRPPAARSRRTAGAEPRAKREARPAKVAESHGYPLDPPLAEVRIPVRAPHMAATTYSRLALMHHFPNAEVGEDLHILFSEPGKAGQSRLAPDVLVALNVPRRATRGDFDVDALGAPDFVLEVLSRTTWRLDLSRKLDCYQRIGVRECLLFDVTGEDLASTGADLWGFAMTPESRRPLEKGLLPNGKRGVYSEVLGLWAYVAERVRPVTRRETWALAMRWYDPATGTDLQDYGEAVAGQEAQRNRADAAERRIAELEALLRGQGQEP